MTRFIKSWIPGSLSSHGVFFICNAFIRKHCYFCPYPVPLSKLAFLVMSNDTFFNKHLFTSFLSTLQRSYINKAEISEKDIVSSRRVWKHSEMPHGIVMGVGWGWCNTVLGSWANSSVATECSVPYHDKMTIWRIIFSSINCTEKCQLFSDYWCFYTMLSITMLAGEEASWGVGMQNINIPWQCAPCNPAHFTPD